jgi:hypothetical protein
MRTKLFATAITLALATVIWAVGGAGLVGAIQDSEDMPVPFGIAQGQSARINILNVGDGGIIIIGGKFLDSRNNLLMDFGREPTEVAPGHIMSVDFFGDRSAAPRDGFGRIQMRAVVTTLGGPDTKRDLLISVEVIDNATGKTTALIGSATRVR